MEENVFLTFWFETNELAHRKKKKKLKINPVALALGLEMAPSVLKLRSSVRAAVQMLRQFQTGLSETGNLIRELCGGDKAVRSLNISP